MVYDWVFTSVKMLPYFEALPRSFTYWHLRKGIGRATLMETVHRVLTVDRALADNSIAWTMYEWDAFRFKAVKRLELLETKKNANVRVER